MPRRTVLLGTLSDEAFQEAVAEGLHLLAEHVEALEASALALQGLESWRGLEAIRMVADEEASKFLILLDAVRCPKSDQGRLSRQLKRCHSHLEKGIYAEACDFNPATFSELTALIRPMREEFFLDGPLEVDWIFRNQIEAHREERLYVDYVESDEGTGWLTPRDRTGLASFLPGRSAASRLVAALDRAGLTSAAGLRLTAGIWRGFEPQPGTRWGEVLDRNTKTLDALYEAGLLSGAYSDDDGRTIRSRWTFPLHGLDLRRIEVDREELRRRQKGWSPD